MPGTGKSGSGPANLAGVRSDATLNGASDGRRRAPKSIKHQRSSGRGRSRTFGAIDLGTNNCRLLIARETPQGFKVIDSYSRVVRLGHGLTQTGKLSEDSMSATIEALKVCVKKMKAKRVKRWRSVATEACRRASNGDEFLGRVKEETGLTLEVISPRVEARLAVMGCLQLVDPTKEVALVIDIGGGSTELSWVDIRKLNNDDQTRLHRPPISAWASLPLGVVTLSDRVPETEDRTQWYEAMKDEVRQAIIDQGCETRFSRAFETGRGHLIGTSGTITSLAGIHLKLPYYQRKKVDGLWLRSYDAVSVARDMASRSLEDRAKEPCIGEDRAKMLVAGCAIIDVICEKWPSKMIRVADRGLREGMLIGLVGANREGSSIPSVPPQNLTEEAAK